MTVADELFLLTPFSTCTTTCTTTCTSVTNDTKKTIDYCYVSGTLNTPNERGIQWEWMYLV
jgi:hypothetical protein